ncbi:MAG: hypothetical protein CUN52_08880 [Phototrophicales bacterium]|nr:MAG: hypothetical protein CUN52_08880 [Phototrophicales bacterium]
MSNSNLLEKTMDMALQLPIIERLQLVERLVASVEHDITTLQRVAQGSHWGERLVSLIESLDLSDWEEMDIDDPVQWVEHIRKQDEARLKPFWDGDK